MRATAQNPALARVAGVDTDGVIRATWVIGAMLAAIAGIFAGIVGQVRPGLGLELLLPLFAAAILGGIGSVRGAVLGGYIVGLAESFSAPLVGAEYRAATAFVVLIGILLVRPAGIFGERG
jgi:branched-chain amino acid transport system permease protein